MNLQQLTEFVLGLGGALCGAMAIAFYVLADHSRERAKLSFFLFAMFAMFATASVSLLVTLSTL